MSKLFCTIAAMLVISTIAAKAQPEGSSPHAGIARIECDPNCSVQAAERTADWWTRVSHKFFDDPLAILTAVLAAATAGLVFMALRQARDFRKFSQIRARAYVVAGPGGTVTNKTTGQVLGKAVTVGNYGITPAYLEKIRCGMCLRREWPLPESRKPKLETYEDVLYPNMTRHDVEVVGKSAMLVSATEEQVFYGDIVYKDVFGKRKYSSWQHRVVPPHWGVVALPGSYTKGQT
jgi:hypothetical protein